MARIYNSYDKPFLLDEAKLRRIKSLIDEKYAELQLTPKYKFEVYTVGQRNYTYNDLDALLSLDNSKKERIKDLFLTCTHGDIESAKNEDKDRIEIHFHGGFNTSMCLIIRDENTKWANEVNAVLDEQIDRTVQIGVMTRISHQKWPIAVIILIAILLGSMFSSGKNSGKNSFTLEASDVTKLESILSDTSTTNQEKADDAILLFAQRALENANAENASLWHRMLSDWTTVFLLIPPAIIIISLLYVAFMCYPSAVYFWGDAKDWFKSIENRRRTVWSVIIVSTIMGILGNLFVVGLENLIR